MTLSNLNITKKGDFSPLLYSNGNSIMIYTSIGQAGNSNIAYIEGESEIILNYCQFVCLGKDDNSN